MKKYLNTFPKNKSALVESIQSSSTKRFGGNKEAKAVQTIKSPAIIGNKNYFMEVDAMKNVIPLLISKK